MILTEAQVAQLRHVIVTERRGKLLDEMTELVTGGLVGGVTGAELGEMEELVTACREDWWVV